MADINKLKNKARREEQRENWSRAIELYTRALEKSRSEHAGHADLSLYNRIGDIHLRQGDKEKAVACYEEAIASYAEDDLHTSAIALCNKVLRVLPSRVEIYRRLGELHAATGLAADARLNYVRYAEAMEKRGDAEEAIVALRECVDETRDPEAAVLLARRLEGTDPLDEDILRLEAALEGASGSAQAPELEERLGTLRGASAGVVEAEAEAPGDADGAEPPERSREAEGDRATEDPAPAAAVEPDPWAELGVDLDEQPWSAAPEVRAEGSAAEEEPAAEAPAEEAATEEAPAAPVGATSAAGGSEVAPSPNPDADPGDGTPELPLVPRVAAELPERSGGQLRSRLPTAAGVAIDPIEPVAGTARLGRSGAASAVPESVEPAALGPPAVRTAPGRPAATEPTASPGPLTTLARAFRGSRREASEALARLGTLAVERRPASEEVEGSVRGGSPARGGDAATPAEAGEAATRPPRPVPVGLRFPPEGREASGRGEFDWMELLTGSELRLPDRLADGRRDAAEPGKSGRSGASESAPERISRRARRFFFGGGDDGAESNGGAGARTAETEPAPGTVRPGSPEGSVPYPCAPEPSIRPAEVVLLGSVDGLAAELREMGAVAAIGETVGSAPPEVGEVPSRPAARCVSLVAPAPEGTEAAVGAVAAEALSAVQASIDELRVVVEERAARRVREEQAAERARQEERAGDRGREESPAPSGDEVDGAAGRVAGPVAGPTGPIAPEIAEPPASAAPPHTRAEESLGGATAPARSPGPIRTGIGTGTGAGGSSPGSGITAGEGEGDVDETFNQWVRSASADVLHASREELERRGEIGKALRVVERLLELEDGDPRLLRKRVAYATELGDGEALPRSYLALGRCLEADGDRREARATYAELLEHDPGNVAARAALERLEDTPSDEEPRARPADPAPAGSAGGDDGTSRREDIPGLRVEPGPTGSASEGDSMMVGTADAPTVRPYDEVQEDGPVDFEELLTDLRSQLVEDAPERDTRTRTELAAELKEMGLLDDAIRELQAAIREADPPPEAFELLGEAFLEKGKPRIAARLLASALEAGDRGDREFLGVLYQLGIAYEQLREPVDALECYERIFSVNIDYRDIQARIQACST